MKIFAIDPEATSIYEITRSKKSMSLKSPIFLMLFDRMAGRIMPVIELKCESIQTVMPIENNAICFACEDDDFRSTHIQVFGWSKKKSPEGEQIMPGHFGLMKIEHAIEEDSSHNRKVALKDIIDDPPSKLEIQKKNSVPSWPEVRSL